MGNKTKERKTEVDLSRSVCPYKKEGSTLVFPCRGCRGKGTLDDRRCRVGNIRVLSGETSVESIVLAEYNETMYSSETVGVLYTISDILVELDGLCEEEHKTRSRGGYKCGKCPLNPTEIYVGLRKRGIADIGELYDGAREAFFAQSPEEGCTECRETTKDHLLLLLQMVEETRKQVLALSIGAIIAEEETTKRGLKAIKSQKQDTKKLLETVQKVDTGGLQGALEIALEDNRRIRPCFSNAWLDPDIPPGGILVRGKRADGARIRMFQIPGSDQSHYHLLPIEYSYPREDVKLIQEMREEMLSKEPGGLELGNHSGVRRYIETHSSKGFARMLQEERGMRRIDASARAKNMAKILARYTAGMGVMEYVLQDDIVQDVYVDAPSQENPVYLTAGVSDQRLAGKMLTNIVLDKREMDTVVSRLRHISGLPFSEATPVLETDLAECNTRATAIGPPLSPAGVAFAFRRHSTEPWTIPRLVSVGSMSPLAGGLLWFLIDGQSTMLVTGSRGAGKSSLLGALLFALPRSQRMLLIEDTLELPVGKLQELGYKAQGLQLGQGLDGRDALRVSLRLGEGALVLGEVRGDEARILYEAMRTGTAGSTVLGTFHADSPRAVYERVVHDLGIQFQSFSATDIIVISGLVRPGGGSRVLRRVTEIAEVDKNNEGRFRTLMEYDEAKDSLVPTEDFYYRSEVISSIARKWGMRMEEATENIVSRASVIEKIVEHGGEYTFAKWTARSFETFIDMKQRGTDDVLPQWLEWFKERVEYG